MSNWMMIVERPAELSELIIATPEIWPNWRSSGVVTSAAIVDALAPGYCVVTTRLGASMSGSAETGRPRKPIRPSSSSATIRSEVAIGRWMKMEEKLMRAPRNDEGASSHFSRLREKSARSAG